MQEFLHIEFNSLAILNDGTEYLPVHFGLVWSSVMVRRGVSRFTDTGSLLKRVNTRNESGKPTVCKKVTEVSVICSSRGLKIVRTRRNAGKWSPECA